MNQPSQALARAVRAGGGRRRRALWPWVVLACAGAAAFWGLGLLAAGKAIAPLRAEGCGALAIVDRAGQPLRTIPAGCGHRGRAQWLALREVPELLRLSVVQSEDRRFEQHLGVDGLAVARAVFEDLRAGRAVSGASTLTMQLARMLHQSGQARTFANKLEQAWLAFAIERGLSKHEILEAYLNHAYYGAGAYGVAAAAATYFGKAPRALSDGEATLLAVLPRAPGAYDPRRHLGSALRRRSSVLRALVDAGQLSSQRMRAIEAEPIAVRAEPATPAFEAGHFVDAALATLPEAQRRAGGVLVTTLDLGLQRRLQALVAEHVERMANADVAQAAVVVLDTATSEVRALVGSGDYRQAQVDIVTRRRQLGSLLKPFVYALAIEGGASADSIALDIGDVTSEYRARDWVGREAGPLSYREALAGSYNLAAVHVLERVGVQALHARLRQAGVAALEQPPDRYGLPLALGSARVRLLDVAAGYGFLVRDGFVRRPRFVRSLQRIGAPPRSAGAVPLTDGADDMRWRPDPDGETRLFSSAVSFQVMDMLSDAAARHRRFGRDLPIEGEGRVVAKTGTASGLSDVSAVLASREFIVAAWAGRFDGAPTQGTSGMWAAAPLARRALDIALAGRAPTLPAPPTAIATPAVGGDAPRSAPAEIEPWAERARILAMRTAHSPR